MASALVTAEVAGIDYRLAEWTTSKTAAQNKSASPAFLVDEGKGVVLRWHLKTSNAAYKAIMKVPEYSYSFVECILNQDAAIVAQISNRMNSTI